jgi:hypothetical protein
MTPSCGSAAAERWERAADSADVLQVPAAASNMSTVAKIDVSSLPPANMAMAWRGRAAAARYRRLWDRDAEAHEDDSAL